jgi:hypothetical protein
MFKKIALFIAMIPPLFAYNMADVNINGSDLQVSGTSAAKMSSTTTAYYTLSYLAVEDEFEQKHSSIYGDMLLSGKQNKMFNFGLGFRAQYVNLDSDAVDDFVCIPLRGKLYFTLPVKAVKTVFSAEIAYAPEVLMFSDDFSSSSETRFELSAELIENGFVYFGIRDFDVEVKDSGESFQLNDQASFLGLKMEF